MADGWTGMIGTMLSRRSVTKLLSSDDACSLLSVRCWGDVEPDYKLEIASTDLQVSGRRTIKTTG
jgi:hypothetical protein